MLRSKPQSDMFFYFCNFRNNTLKDVSEMLITLVLKYCRDVKCYSVFNNIKFWRKICQHLLYTLPISNFFVATHVYPNSPYPFFCFSSEREGSNNGGSLLDSNLGPPTPQCTVHPWHATRVSLPQQLFRAHMRHASMM